MININLIDLHKVHGIKILVSSLYLDMALLFHYEYKN